jgi:hypothetical protein
MTRRTLLLPGAILALLLLLTACGDGADSRETAQTPAEQAAALDQGPRASAAMKLDDTLAARGEALYEEKSCSDFHTLGESDIWPDLLGVMDRRTQPWLTKQITEPEWMSQHDIITKQLVVDFDLEMADLGVEEAEVEPILHYLLREGGSGER